jgi:Lon protease-like protein
MDPGDIGCTTLNSLRETSMPSLLPLFPLGTVLFPGMPMPLHIFEPRYLQLMHDHGTDTIPFGVALIHSERPPHRPWPAHSVGTAAMITGRTELPDGRWDLVVEGQQRFRIVDFDESQRYGIATIEWLEEMLGDPTDADALLRTVVAQFHRYAGGITRLTKRRFSGVMIPEDPVRASYDLVSRLPLHTWERQRLLEAGTAVERLRELSLLVERELALLLHAGAAGLAVNHPGSRFSLN